jgi:hypothetical protein
MRTASRVHAAAIGFLSVQYSAACCVGLSLCLAPVPALAGKAWGAVSVSVSGLGSTSALAVAAGGVIPSAMPTEEPSAIPTDAPARIARRIAADISPEPLPTSQTTAGRDSL